MAVLKSQLPQAWLLGIWCTSWTSGGYRKTAIENEGVNLERFGRFLEEVGKKRQPISAFR